MFKLTVLVIALAILNVHADYTGARKSNRVNLLSQALGAKMLAGTMDTQSTMNNGFMPITRAIPTMMEMTTMRMMTNDMNSMGMRTGGQQTQQQQGGFMTGPTSTVNPRMTDPRMMPSQMGMQGQMTGQMGNQMTGQMGNQMTGQMGTQMQGQMPTQMQGQMGTQMPGQMGTQMGNQMTGQMGTQMTGQMGTQMQGQMPTQIQGQMTGQTGTQMPTQMAQMGTQMTGQMGTQMQGQMPTQMQTQTGTQMPTGQMTNFGQMGQQMGQMGQQMGQMGQQIGQMGGQMMNQMGRTINTTMARAPTDLCSTNQAGDIVANPANPTQFVICYGFGEFTIMDCPEHLVYNPHLIRCDLEATAPAGCASNPCLNNGKCIDLPQLFTFRCECPSGFTGQMCEKLDACSQKPCGPDGVCISMAPGSPIPNVCMCNSGRSIGTTCNQQSVEMNPCFTPSSNLKQFPTRINPSVFVHCEGLRPHFVFCQFPLVYSPSRQVCDWTAQ